MPFPPPQETPYTPANARNTSSLWAPLSSTAELSVLGIPLGIGASLEAWGGCFWGRGSAEFSPCENASATNPLEGWYLVQCENRQTKLLNLWKVFARKWAIWVYLRPCGIYILLFSISCSCLSIVVFTTFVLQLFKPTHNYGLGSLAWAYRKLLCT